MATVKINSGTSASTLVALFEKGVRYATVIDIGCADGHFFLYYHSLGIFSGASVLNIDANAIYEPSLKAIQEVIGGHYFIGAMTDHAGEIEMTNAVHPYWNSLRPEQDLYWERLNRLSGTKVKVPTQTLDALVTRLQLKPPYLQARHSGRRGSGPSRRARGPGANARGGLRSRYRGFRADRRRPPRSRL